MSRVGLAFHFSRFVASSLIIKFGEEGRGEGIMTDRKPTTLFDVFD